MIRLGREATPPFLGTIRLFAWGGVSVIHIDNGLLQPQLSHETKIISVSGTCHGMPWPKQHWAELSHHG